MTEPTRPRSLGGHQVIVSLLDGSGIDDCQLVAIGRHALRTLWLDTNGDDHRIPATEGAHLQDDARRAA